MKCKTINISKCFGDIIDHESEAPMVCDITRNPRCIYSCLHTALFFVVWDTLIQIEMKMIENFRNMKKEIFLFVPLSFQPQCFVLSSLSSQFLLYLGSQFLYLDLLVFLDLLKSWPVFPILACENTFSATGNLFTGRISQ